MGAVDCAPLSVGDITYDASCYVIDGMRSAGFVSASVGSVVDDLSGRM